jgi:hypothetical protein
MREQRVVLEHDAHRSLLRWHESGRSVDFSAADEHAPVIDPLEAGESPQER